MAPATPKAWPTLLYSQNPLMFFSRREDGARLCLASTSDTSGFVVSVLLNHAPPLRQIPGIIVRGADAVAFAVGKLTLDPVRVIARFIQECGRH